MAKLETLDRTVLENVILPTLAGRPDVRRVLFVGCAEYTQAYERYFAGSEYYTIEIDPKRASFGATAPGHHFIDSVENVRAHFDEGALDLIFMNGVFGYGLDDRDQANATIERCHEVLAPGGTLVIGWNDLPECKPFEPVELGALARFERAALPELEVLPEIERQRTGDYLVVDHYRHVFSFFRKRP